MKLSVALLQLNPGRNPVESFDIAKLSIIEAKKSGAHIVLLPELWTNAYKSPDAHPEGRIAWESESYTVGGPGFADYQQLACDEEIAIALPFLLKNDDGTFSDAVSIIDRKGDVLLTYRKVHTVDKIWEVEFTSGDTFPVADLYISDTDFVKVGTMICYDREFPEVARILMLNGAEVVLVPNACDLENNRIAQFQARGFENMYGVAMTNYPLPKHNGQSIAFDGMREKGVDYNPLIVRADDSEGIWYAEFDIEKLRAYREKEIWGDAYRKPRLYAQLLENSPKTPFIRPSAKR